MISLKTTDAALAFILSIASISSKTSAVRYSIVRLNGTSLHCETQQHTHPKREQAIALVVFNNTQLVLLRATESRSLRLLERRCAIDKAILNAIRYEMLLVSWSVAGSLVCVL